MKITGNKSEVETRKIIIVGAGKIGRSFIGQLFGCNGYKVVFIDVDPVLVDLLNRNGSYRVVIKGEKEEELVVPNVQAILATDKKKVIENIATAGIMAISVGKNSIEKVMPDIAEGLLNRFTYNPGKPLDIILAENMRSAADYVKEELKKYLLSGFLLNSFVGLIETSIGKMVPIIPLAELEKDPLVVFAEPYNILILDRNGFKSPIPDIKELAPKNNIMAWVDRKAFIHNLGHATASYYGHYYHPGKVYLYDILEDKEVLKFTRNVMLQSAQILKATYPNEFTYEDLEKHIDNLIFRFKNKALQDTIFRVGHDLTRKLSVNDRFVGIIHLAQENGMPYDLILEAMSYGLHFRAQNEEGKLFPPDVVFLDALAKEFEATLMTYLFLDPVNDLEIIKEIKKQYLKLA
jgi:mannitol-1-phosphate 5-dehydrogenase